MKKSNAKLLYGIAFWALLIAGGYLLDKNGLTGLQIFGAILIFFAGNTLAAYGGESIAEFMHRTKDLD